MEVKNYSYAFLFTALLFITLFVGCTEETPHDPVVKSVTDDTAEEYANVVLQEITPSVSDNFEVDLWASEKLVSDPVGLHVDNDGRVYVTITERRGNSELDIRDHTDWVIESIGMETVEDKKDFISRELSSKNSDKNTWLPDYNKDGLHDRRDLAVNKESVLRIEDSTGNGYANKSDQYIYNFQEEITDVAGAVLYHEGDVFLGVSPDLWRIKDTNGDGAGDQKESIVHGFGTNIGFGGHGMSGLTTGPDGRIYWSIGDVGMSVVDQDGKRWHYPRQGVIVRSEPDGSNFEVFASGLRNTHEFVFDKFGNLITIDNDGDHAGEYERLVYLVNGSDSGWRLNWQIGKYNDPKNNNYKVLMDEGYFRTRFDDQAAHILPPVDRYVNGHSGMAYNPGTALNAQWNDYFFVGKFVGTPENSGIHAFTLNEKGASFELDKEAQILEGFLPTSLDFGPDGALYFSDWIEGWSLKQKGRIWKVNTSSNNSDSLKIETRSLLAEDYGTFSSSELLTIMQHEDMRVRKKAQFELASRSDTDSFLEALKQTDHQLARIHAIWGLTQIARRSPDAAELLIPYLNDPDSEIRAQVAKMLGDVKYKPAGDFLIPLLEDENLRVLFFTTEALGRLSWQPAFDPIVEMLEMNNDEDVYLRHAGAISLERLGDDEALTELSGHTSRAVRIAAVVALNRLNSPGVVQFLKDEDEFIVTNAARAINDDTMIEEGLNELSTFLEQDRFLNEPLVRRAINASLYLGSAESAQRLASFTVREDVPDELRAEALETLAVWPAPSVLDRVTGDPRGEIENDPAYARNAVEPKFSAMLDDENESIKISGLKTAGNLNLKSVIRDIIPHLRSDPSPDIRIASLEALAKMEYAEMEEAVFVAMADDNKNVRVHALRILPGLDLPQESIVELSEDILEKGTVDERQLAFEILGSIDHSSSYALLDQQLKMLLNRELDNEIELDLLIAVESVNEETLNNQLQKYQAEKNRNDSVSVYRESLYGGDEDKGREIFYHNAAAQCIRCHVVDGEGSDVGPDLTNVGNRMPRRELLEAMVHPGARITPGYGSVTLTLNNGDSVRGMLSAETETHLSVTTRDQELVIEKNNIAERNNSPSGMPAMGNELSRSELRDLVQYLTRLKGESE